MASEITEEEEDDEEKPSYIVDKEAEKQKIKHIIDYQKSLYFSSSSSSSSSSFSASRSSFSSPQKSSSLLGLMKEGSTSLRRLFDMEHTSLGNYFKDYSGSPIIKPILLWGSDSDDAIHDDPWMEIKQIKNSFESSRIDDQSGVVSSKVSFDHDDEIIRKRILRIRRRKLNRTKSYKRLPRFVLWKLGGFKFRFRLRVLICGRKI
ncbi:Uncharacterized protein Adt_32463 [Abeliophyllum distichum]|uniref:Uncharacterized protein n=1 Tax=Abeliophyllum distichum TaxID=126358 RepID=A0ABD1QUR5_9LAMI